MGHNLWARAYSSKSHGLPHGEAENLVELYTAGKLALGL
jgi:hypothetical protein